MTDTQTGIFYGVSREEYGKIDACNQSALKPYAKSALAGKFAEDHRESTAEQEFGTALHCLTLEPDQFKKRYAVMPKVDKRTKEGKAEMSKAETSAKGKHILPDKGKFSVEWLEGCHKALLGHPDVNNLFSRGMEREACLVWQDEDTGIMCKALLDAIIDSAWATLGDLKSSGSSVDEDEFSFQMFKWGYHTQSAFYLDGYITLTGKRNTNFVIVPVESKPPHHCAFYQMNGPSLALGRKTYKPLLPIWAKAKSTGEYPGLPQGIREIGVPAFRLKELT